MSTTLYIITGASRGMGEAIATQLLSSPERCVIGISRGQSAALTEAARISGAALEQWLHDLAEPLSAAKALQAWLEALPPGRFSSATLINNAGVVPMPGPVDDTSLEELSAALRVGLEATLLLSSAFLRATAQLGSQRRILNISSGLGRRAMALDEAAKPAGATIVSLAPGVIDTDMQTQLRAGDPAKFPDRAQFVNFKTNGQLQSPPEAARKVLAYLARADFGRITLADLRDPS